MKKQVKKIIFILITSLLVIAPIGSNIGLSFNQTIITYAAKSSKKSSSSSKKKKTTTKKSTKKKSDSTKKKTTGQGTIKKSTTKKKNTTNNYSSSKKSSSTYNSNSNTKNYNSGAKKSVISDNTTCYVSEGGKCYHRLSSCAGKTNQSSMNVGMAKRIYAKCKKCW